MLVASIITLSVFSGVETSAVVIKNPDDNGKYVPTFRITTADVSTLENRDKVITLATNKNSDIDSVSFAIVGGADESKASIETDFTTTSNTKTCRRFIYIGYGYSKDFFSRLIALKHRQDDYACH
jgi:hypothetical protein